MPENPVVLTIPAPTVPLADLREQLVQVLDQVNRHAFHGRGPGEQSRLVAAGSHVALAHALIGTGDLSLGQQVPLQQALKGLQVLCGQKGLVHEH